MATKQIVGFFVYFLLIFAYLAEGRVFDGILDDVTSCKEICKNTYAPHTYEKTSSEECCHRGCRLFSMMEFLYEDVNKTTQTCQASCKEAYPDVDDLDACKLGCKSQKPFALDNILREDPWEQQIRFLSPVTYMHQWYSNVFNNIMNQASVSWTMYMKDNDGSVVVVKSPKQFKVYELKDGFATDDFNTASSVETNLKPMDKSATPSLKSSSYNAHRNDDDLIDLSVRDLEDYRNKRRLEEEANDWLSCVSRKTGLPRIVLSWLLLMCAIVMIWLCLSAAVTSLIRKYTVTHRN